MLGKRPINAGPPPLTQLPMNTVDPFSDFEDMEIEDMDDLIRCDPELQGMLNPTSMSELNFCDHVLQGMMYPFNFRESDFRADDCSTNSVCGAMPPGCASLGGGASTANASRSH